MVSTFSPPAVVDFPDQNHHYKSIVNKFLAMLGWHQSHTYTGPLPLGIKLAKHPIAQVLNHVTMVPGESLLTTS